MCEAVDSLVVESLIINDGGVTSRASYVCAFGPLTNADLRDNCLIENNIANAPTAIRDKKKRDAREKMKRKTANGTGVDNWYVRPKNTATMPSSVRGRTDEEAAVFCPLFTVCRPVHNSQPCIKHRPSPSIPAFGSIVERAGVWLGWVVRSPYSNKFLAAALSVQPAPRPFGRLPRAADVTRPRRTARLHCAAFTESHGTVDPPVYFSLQSPMPLVASTVCRPPRVRSAVLVACFASYI
ncbi:hypothetical protein GWI33_009145 [Rhynchophorus ferrugineus]|uniref:Uncharacterized protein n=1 Tax=Rhynchophorus ferrugineus TaxID=354439 RepID=A0A834MDQ7_RHYFE|nr:hypothetical protein GWI33_009145 [Rhynchophorus ferrugineus]